ncbi:unnamed protein product, partial [Sphacelaria rigidula]
RRRSSRSPQPPKRSLERTPEAAARGRCNLDIEMMKESRDFPRDYERRRVGDKDRSRYPRGSRSPQRSRRRRAGAGARTDDRHSVGAEGKGASGVPTVTTRPAVTTSGSSSRTRNGRCRSPSRDRGSSFSGPITSSTRSTSASSKCRR